MTKRIEPDNTVEGIEQEYRLDDRPIWEVIDAVIRHVPEQVLNRLPADGAERHDHYLYDSPEKAPRTS